MKSFDLFARQRAATAPPEEPVPAADSAPAPAASQPPPAWAPPADRAVDPAPPPAPMAPMAPVAPVESPEDAAEPDAVPEGEHTPPADQPLDEVVEQPTDDVDEPHDEPHDEPVAGAVASLDAEIADHWDLWAEQIGRAVRADLVAAQERVPTLTSAMVTTVDGQPLATIGLADEQVARFAALPGSVHVGAAAAVRALSSHQPPDAAPDVITLHHGPHQTVVLTVPGLVVGTLLLWMTADAASLGVLLIHARSTAAAIRSKLGADDVGSLTAAEHPIPAHPR